MSAVGKRWSFSVLFIIRFLGFSERLTRQSTLPQYGLMQRANLTLIAVLK